MKEKSKRSFKGVFISLLVTVIIWIGLIYVEKSIVTPNGQIEVIMASDNIKKGTEITETNVDTYFEEKIVDGGLEVNNAVQSKESLIGMVTDINVVNGVILSNDNFIKKENQLLQIKNPVEISFKVSDMSQVVGGILREGDLINISINSDFTKENEKVLDNVYVYKVFSNDGKNIDQSNTETVAVTINIMIAEEDEENFNSKLALGTIRVSRVNK